MKPWEKAGLFAGLFCGTVIGICAILYSFFEDVGNIGLFIIMALLGGPILGAVWGIFMGYVFEFFQKWIPGKTFTVKGIIFGLVLGIIFAVGYGEEDFIVATALIGLPLLFGSILGYLRKKFGLVSIPSVEYETERKKIRKQLFIAFLIILTFFIVSVGFTIFAVIRSERSFLNALEEMGLKFEIPEEEPNKISGSKFQSLVTTINGCVHYQDGSPVSYPTVHLVVYSKGDYSMALLSSDEKGCFRYSGGIPDVSGSPSVSYFLVVEGHPQGSSERVKKDYIFDIEKDLPLDLIFP